MAHTNNDRDQINEDCLWKVISYLAANADMQIRAIGPCSFNFYSNHIEMKEHETYLVGIYMTYLTLWGRLERFRIPTDDQSTSSHLKSRLDDMFWTSAQGSTNFWNFSALHENPAWAEVRILANSLLREAGRKQSFPELPIQIEDFVEGPTDPSILDLL